MRHSDLVAQIPVFSSLSVEDRNALAERLQERQWASGTTVFAKGEEGASMYLVLSGAVQVVLPGEQPGAPAVVLKRLHAGDYFGELALFDEKPRSASVTVLEDTRLLELTRENFADHLAQSKTAAMTVLREMAERLRETNELIGHRAAKDAVKEVEDNLTWPQRMAERVAELNGSWTFILGITGLTGVWALSNYLLTARAFDPYPYQFFNLFLGILTALQGPLIVMTQNRQATKDRAQAETDFNVNLKNEVGIERMGVELGAHRAETAKRLAAIEDGVRPEVLVRELLAALAKAQPRPSGSA